MFIRNLLAASILVTASAAMAEGPFSDLSFDAACEKAKADEKIIMIDFYTTWCGPCKMLDRTTWKDDNVQAWLKDKTVSLKIDAEKETKLAKRFKVNAYPTIVFIKHDGSEIDRLVGYRDAAGFLAEAKGALSGKDAVARARDAAGERADSDPMAKMKIADALVQKGRHEEALKEYMWCWDEGGDAMGFSGVRVSFLLSNIKRLGQEYPPALKALKKRRNALKKSIMGGDTSHGAIADFGALNRTLDDKESTLAVFDALKDKGDSSKKARGQLLQHIVDPLIEAKRYDDIMDNLPDGPLDEVNKAIERYRDTKKNYVKKDGGGDITTYMKKSAIETAGKYYEAALGAGKADEAREISDAVLKLDDSEDTLDGLIEHAKRAGAKDAAKSLAARKAKSDDSDDD